MNSQRTASGNRYSIFNARTLSDHGDFQESISNYLGVLHSTSPDSRLQYLAELVTVLKHYFDIETDDARVTATINEACALPDMEFHICRARSEWLFMRGKIFNYFLTLIIC